MPSLIIKLLRQPIIAINEAEIAGTVDGVLIKGNKVSSVYLENMENQFSVSAENIIFGADAVMIQDMTALNLVSRYEKPLRSMLDVYNISGRHLGHLEGLEVDEEFAVRYIHTDKFRFDISKLVSYECVIIADVEEHEIGNMDNTASIVEKNITAEAETEAEAEAEVSMDIGPDINWNEENVQPAEKAHEASELAVVRTIHQPEEKPDTRGVDPKYAYLCGKMLLESIEIEDTIYENGTIIDANLIKHAIANNAIVKVIVNAEE